MRNESARMDARLLVDYQTILEGHCKYVPHLLGGAADWSRIQALARDLDHTASADSGGMVCWSKHLKHENPDWSPAFASIVQAMADYFGRGLKYSLVNLRSQFLSALIKLWMIE